MSKSNKRAMLWRGLAGVMAALLTISIGVTSIANANASFLNTRLGTFNTRLENTGGVYFVSEFDNLTQLVEAKDQLAVELASEGTVLLKNNGALPLNISSETVTLWGLNSHTPTLAGMIGSSAAYDPSTGQVAYGIEEALAERGYKVNETMIAFYSEDFTQGFLRRGFGQTGHGMSPSFGMTYENPSAYPVGELPPDMYTSDVLGSADGTAAVVVISRDNSEAADYNPNMVNGTEGDSFERPLALSDYEKGMIGLAKAHSSKVIVLINASNPVEIEELKQDADIDAILWVGTPGMRGFLGVADVLSGAVNPSGHLPDTFAVSSVSSPAMQNFGLYFYTNYSKAASGAQLTEDDKADWYVVETEGIYTGYKYYETRYEDQVLGQGNASSSAGSSGSGDWSYANEVSYPFGYGLSYTTFEQTLDSININVGGESTAVVTVKNTGSVPGKSVVQLYVQTPYVKGGLEKASIQLLDFGKTGVLAPGATEQVKLTFDLAYMASYDETAVKANGTTGAWVLDQGDYYFAIGNGAHEALNNVLAAKTGSNTGLIVTADTDVINAGNAKLWSLGKRDMETYSANVQNALQDMDINKLIPGTAEYTTRSDWTKGWKSVDSITPTNEMMVGLTNKNYILNANGEGTAWGVDHGLKLIDFMITDPNTGLCIGVLDLDDPKWDELIEQIPLKEAANFIQNGGDDYDAMDSIMAPVYATNDGPVGYTFDQMGGYSVRWFASMSDEPTYVSDSETYAKYAMNTMPTEPVVAATFNKELVAREGELFGEDSLWANSHEYHAPGLNLHRTPYCARNHEYYSEDAVLTALMGDTLCRSAQPKGVTMCPKHLAFNHQELNRSGVSTFMTEQAARENELRAFQLVFSNNSASGVMTAFNRAGTVYSGAHSGLQEQILRTEWGYKGWVVTDMVNGPEYMNWRDAVAGGGLVALSTTAYDTSKIGPMISDANLKAIQEDTFFQLKMKEGLKYYLHTIAGNNVMNGYNSETEIVYFMTWWQKALIGVDVALGLITAAVLVKHFLVTKKGAKES